jgi:hypothetical protein
MRTHFASKLPTWGYIYIVCIDDVYSWRNRIENSGSIPTPGGEFTRVYTKYTNVLMTSSVEEIDFHIFTLEESTPRIYYTYYTIVYMSESK